MSEWRFRISTRANRECCTPITTEQRKNQRFRLMKRVRTRATPDVVSMRALSKSSVFGTQCKKINFVVENFDM
jgi:hypothetical protein